MSRWDAGTILAFSIWTLWTAAALALLGTRRAGPFLSGCFLVLGVVLWAGSDVTWRGYLEGALVVQLGLVATGIHDTAARRRLLLTGAVSGSGVAWLAVTGGPRYWAPTLVGLALAMLAGGVALLVTSRTARWKPSIPRQRSTAPAPASPSVPSRGARPSVAGPAPTPVDRSKWRSSQQDENHADDERRSSRSERRPVVEEQHSARPTRHRDHDRSLPGPAGAGPDEPRAHRSRPPVQPRGVEPGESRAHRSRPPVQPRGDLSRPAYLYVQAVTGASVNVVGMGRIFAPSTVRIDNSRTVVAGDDVTVDLSTHLWVKQAKLSLDVLRECTAALDDLLRGGSVDTFQRLLLRALREREREPGSSQERLSVKPQHRVEVYDCTYVRVSDGTRTDIDKRVVFETTVLPLAMLLVRDAELCRLLANALQDRATDEDQASFLRRALTVGGRLEDRDLILGARGDMDDATVRGLFGTARVRGAEVAVVGAGNELRSRLELNRPGFDRASLREGLDDLRRDREPGRVDRADARPMEPGERTTSPVFDNPDVNREWRTWKERDDMWGTDRPGRDLGGFGGRSL